MKLPWMQFHTGDWRKDPQLSMCLPATRGIWIDALAAMHESDRSGYLTGTPGQLARALRCTEPELMAALSDLRATGAALITERSGIVTLINRRMKRESKDREANRLRQKRARAKDQGNDGVTQMLASGNGNGSSSLSLSSKKEKEALRESMFKAFYKRYPRHEKPQAARKAFFAANIDEAQMVEILAWIEKAEQSEQWQDKGKIPHPSSFLNGRYWDGDPPPLPSVLPATGRNSGVGENTVTMEDYEDL